MWESLVETFESFRLIKIVSHIWLSVEDLLQSIFFFSPSAVDKYRLRDKCLFLLHALKTFVPSKFVNIWWGAEDYFNRRAKKIFEPWTSCVNKNITVLACLDKFNTFIGAIVIRKERERDM